MRQQPIVEQLKQGGFARVYGALELAGLKDRPERLPALFVVPEGKSATPNRTTGAHDQLESVNFGVVLVLDGTGRREDQVSDELAEQEAKVIDALTGWTHPDASRACDYAGGQMVSADRHTVSWMVRFITARRIRKAQAT